MEARWGWMIQADKRWTEQMGGGRRREEGEDGVRTERTLREV